MLLLLLKEYVKPQQTKFLIHPTEDCVNEETTVELELRSVANDTLREATLVPPTITIEEQVYNKATVVPPPHPVSNKKLQGDWATRDRSIFPQQQLPGSRSRSRRGSNASEPDNDMFSQQQQQQQQQQHTWANRVERTPEKSPQSTMNALERNFRESSPFRSSPPSEKSGQVTPPQGVVNRRHSCEQTKRRPGGDYKRVVSSPNMIAASQSGTGRPRSFGYEHSRIGSYGRASKFYKGPHYGSSRDVMAHTPTHHQPQVTVTPSTDYYRPQLGGVAYSRSQSDTRGIQLQNQGQSYSAKSEPVNHSAGASGEWTEVKRKSTKSKNHPPSTQGKSHPKDRRQRR